MGKFRAYANADFAATHTMTASGLRPHFHSGYVIGYLFSGRYRCRLGHAQQMEYRPGEITLLHPAEVHQDYSSEQERDYLTLNIQEHLFLGGLDEFGHFERRLPDFFPPKVQADGQIASVFRSLRRALDRHDHGRDYIIRSLVVKVALYLSHHFASASNAASESVSGKESRRWEIRRALELLNDSYTEQFDLDQFSKVVGLSKYYLEKVFKKSIGMSPYQYVIQLRVEKAKQLLSSSPKSVIEIAMDLGFFDQSHFTNAFRHFTGTSPLAYRLATR
jgi:AraC family transcriptional regulator